MKNRSFAVFLIFASTALFGQVPRGADAGYDLYLLVGQSNMAGRAPLDAVSKEADPHILMLDKNDNWVLATDPVHFDKPNVAGVGPAIAFAREMLLNEEQGTGGQRKIGLIPCAVGGSPIRVWEPDSTYLNGLHPYDDAIRRARAALQQGRLKGILWHQGESDNNPKNAAVYMNKLQALIRRLRKDLDSPDLPFVAGEVGYFGKSTLINTVIDRLPGVVAHTAVVSAEGLTDKGDKTHFDTRSARELGKRYGQAMKKLQADRGDAVVGTAIGTVVRTGLIQHASAREVLSLNGRWNYIIDPYENGFYDYRHQPYDQSPSGTGGFYDDKKQKDPSELIEYDFDASPTLKVPGDWNSQDEKLLFYEGTIWYRRKFRVKPAPGQRYFLYFGAVNYEAHIYLNGKKLGMHKGGFTPFEFEVTGRLADGDNSIVVKADNTRHKDEIPTINTDWWNYGGITRDVFLAATPAAFIADYKIQLAKDDPGKIEGFVQLNGSAGAQEVTVSIPEASIRQTVKTDDAGRAVISIPVKKIVYWSPEHPQLYAVTIRSGADSIGDKIGFRTIQVRGKDILLNGKSVFLRGISIHDENPLIPGRNRSEGDLRMLLTWAKELDCNYVRLAHYPHNETMLRLADEMGLMVWAEVPVYWTISWDNPDTYRNAEQQLSDLINRDRNRASVIVWSIGNETPLSEPRLSFMSRLAAHAHSLDATRLVSAALEVHRNGNEVIVDDPLGEKLDLVSFNEYAGWYWGDKPGDLSRYRFSIKYDRPVIITEFGGDALGGFHADRDTRWSEEYQEWLYTNQLQMLSKIGALRGMTPWILTDFRSPRRQHPIYQNFWNRKGLISETGKKKMAFAVLKAFYETTGKKYK